MPDASELAYFARKLILETSARTGTPHLSSSLSVVDILVCLGLNRQGKVLSRETYLSKGHAALAMYASLVALGRLPIETLDDYCSDGSVFEGHVNSRISGVPLSTGSLGHAAPFAIGRAIGDNSLGRTFQHWVVLSDGELDEGSNWEALLIASHRNLSNFHIIVDRNRIQSLGLTEDTSALEPLDQKLKAFGMLVHDVDGHDHVAILNHIEYAESCGAPTALIANTTKGKGVKDIEVNAVLYHYKPATPQHLADFTSRVEG
jgi:transketolase